MKIENILSTIHEMNVASISGLKRRYEVSFFVRLRSRHALHFSRYFHLAVYTSVSTCPARNVHLMDNRERERE